MAKTKSILSESLITGLTRILKVKEHYISFEDVITDRPEGLDSRKMVRKIRDNRLDWINNILL
jgi:hypothetical protein